MAWFRKNKGTLEKAAPKKAGRDKVPDGLWTKCKACEEILYQPELDRNLNVCTKCGFHFYLPARQRIELLTDEGTFTELFADIEPEDPLGFKDSKRYRDRLKASRKKVGLPDAFVSGQGQIDGLDFLLGVFEFKFMGGSMGSVVGEKVTRLFERGAEKKLPVIIVSASGGARMQEGILSLMQMAKTSAALTRLRDRAHQPYISVLTDPTTGGVAASFAMLGDIIVSEPKALVGFAGPRVIEQTIRQKLPEGFQRAEFLLEHGMIDRIVPRATMKEDLSRVLRLLT